MLYVESDFILEKLNFNLLNHENRKTKKVHSELGI